MGKLKLKVSARLMRKKIKRKTRNFTAKKQCRFCSKTGLENVIDYKNVYLLRSFVTERGKILPSRVSGNCCYHQRDLAAEIKTARSMALLPYCPIHR